MTRRQPYSTKIRKIYPAKPSRIKIPQSPVRPIRITQRAIVNYKLENPWWWIMHRRGIYRPNVGIDPREWRAVSHDEVRGTLPERIVYRFLIDKMKMADGVEFDFQSCMEIHHKVLTADLRWVEVGTLQPGDKLLSFTEDGKSISGKRRWAVGTVLHNHIDRAEVIEVTLSDGRKIYTTPEHPWLVHHAVDKKTGWSKDWGKGVAVNWVQTSDLKIGTYIPVFFDVWEPDTSYEAGWISGFFDGEGSIVHSKSATGGHQTAVTVGQNAGGMFDRFIDYVAGLGFDFSIYDYRGKYKRSYDDGKRQVIQCRIAGGRPEVLRFLGTIRPMKLTNLKIEKLGRLVKKSQVRVVNIQPAGIRDIARLEVDIHTYVAEGFGMHNSIQGGRLSLGGIVADFLFPYFMMIIRVQGPTHNTFIRLRKDEEQRLALEEMGYRVFDLEEEVIYDEVRFEDEMRRIFNLGPHAYGAEFELQLDWDLILAELRQIRIEVMALVEA